MKKVGKSHLFAFIGAPILLSIHRVHNHRKAWSTARAQVLYRLRDLTCQLFNLNGTFLHVVTPAKEDAASGNPLRKLQPLIDHMKAKCFEFYQPRKEISIDQWMAKSKSTINLGVTLGGTSQLSGVQAVGAGGYDWLHSRF